MTTALHRCLLMALFFVAFSAAVSTQNLATVSDGVDYPVGIPDAAGWHVAQDFEDGYDDCHLGEDWNWGSGDDDLGLPVCSIANGRVAYVGNPGPGWNGVIIIDHGPISGPGFLLPGGQWVSEVASMYAHLDLGCLNDWVTLGDCVSRGQQIGIIGPTAAGSTAPHIHFELRTNTNLGDFINNGVGPGYSCNPTTLSYYTDPSDFIDLNRPGSLPLVGDWNGDGVDSIGTFEPGRTGGAPIAPQFNIDGVPVPFGEAGDYPVVGDWDGDGRDEIGLFRVYANHAYFYLDLDNSGGIADKSIFFAYPQDVPLVGDWDGDGDDDIGGYDPASSTFYLYTLSLAASAATSYQDVPYGQLGDCPIVGDWDGDGDDDIGVARPTPSTYAFYLDLNLTGGQHELGPFDYGDVGDIPITGDPDGRGYDRVGIHRPSSGMTAFSEFPNASPNEVVHFPDSQLEQVIREAINKPTGDIHDTDLIGLTSLDAEFRGIANLEGIQHCVDLTRLDLNDNEVVNISPLSGLTNLTLLDLGNNQIVDISPLSGLTNLTYLDLQGNQIVDISPLSGLTNLTELALSDNQIVDISPLSSLTNLTMLWLDNNQIVNITALSGLTNLMRLYLYWNQISDIAPLAGLTNLMYLPLQGNQIVDISPLSGLTNLTKLTLSDNQIVDIAPLAGLINLTDLCLTNNQISNISALSGLINLTRLHLYWNQISDIAPLAGLTNLTNLCLDDNQISDIAPLAGLTRLWSLNLTYNQISDIAPLAGLTNLAWLVLDDNQISDIAPLAGLINLTDLCLTNNQISNISALSGLINLTRLYLYRNQISDISPLVNNTGLGSWDHVDIRHNYLDLTPGADDIQNIQMLIDRGVDVEYEPQNEPPVSRVPVLLVHGFQKLPGYHPTEIWQYMAEVLSGRSISDKEDVSAFPGHTFWRLSTVSEDHVSVYISNYSVELSATWDNILFYADQLQAELAKIRQEEEVEKVDIVAHSMGGLVSRAYLENADFDPYLGTDGYPDFGTSYANDVRKLIMLGTPNHGAELANIASFLQIDDILGWIAGHNIVSVGQMAVGSQFLDVLNYGCHGCSGSDQLNPGVEYTVLAGSNCAECSTSEGLVLPCLSWCIENGKSWLGFDGLVSMDSVRLTGAAEHACLPFDHTALRVHEDVVGAVEGLLRSLTVSDVIWASEIIQVACPVHVDITDEQGNVLSDGGIDEIPGGCLSVSADGETKTFYLSSAQNYELTIDAYASGEFSIVELTLGSDGEYLAREFRHIPIEAGAQGQMDVTLDTTPRTLQLDQDGDGVPDQEYTSSVTPLPECEVLYHEISQQGWHMIALPGELCSPCLWTEDAEICGDLVCAFADDLNPCYVFHYDPGVGSYVMAPPPEAICYHAGMGFWTRTYENNVAIDAEVQVPTEAVEIPLGNGWNQIGNPFPFVVSAADLRVRCGDTELPLADAQTQGWVSAYLFGYDTASGGYQMISPPTGCLEAWSGCWMRAYRDGCVFVIPPTECSSSAPAGHALSVKELQAQGLEIPPPPPTFTPMSEAILDELVVRNVPNPIRSEHTTTFKVEGKGAELVQAIKVEIYNQAGQKVFMQGINAKELEWHTDNDTGELLANGVYLYQVWVKIADTWYPTGVHKLAVVR